MLIKSVFWYMNQRDVIASVSLGTMVNEFALHVDNRFMCNSSVAIERFNQDRLNDPYISIQWFCNAHEYLKTVFFSS